MVNNASGHDMVSHKMLKMTCDPIFKPLQILFNRSLTEGIFPSLWKRAVVMPFFKKGPPEEPSNYGPISLLSTVGKIMERVVFKHFFS